MSDFIFIGGSSDEEVIEVYPSDKKIVQLTKTNPKFLKADGMAIPVNGGQFTTEIYYRDSITYDGKTTFEYFRFKGLSPTDCLKRLFECYKLSNRIRAGTQFECNFDHSLLKFDEACSFCNN